MYVLLLTYLYVLQVLAKVPLNVLKIPIKTSIYCNFEHFVNKLR